MALLKLCLIIFCCVLTGSFAIESEYACSKFPYEEKLLEKMIRMEIKMEDMVKQIKSTEEHVMTVLSNMENKLEKYEVDYNDLEENITKSFTEAKADLNKFKEELEADTKSFNDNLKTEIELKKAEIDTFKDNSSDELIVYKESLKSEIDNKKIEIDRVKQDAIDNLDYFMKNITRDVQKEIAELDLLEVKLGNPVIAFNVHSPPDLSIGTNEVFKYETVLLNKGNGYTVSSGTFRAPMAGLYYFTAHVCAVTGKFVHYGIVVGNEVLAASSQREDTDSSCGSVSVVATVSSGEDVYVRCLTGNSYEAQLNENSVRWNSFVGALIQ